jgi:hypothetical protein
MRMKLEKEINNVLVDYIPDPDERECCLNNTIYYMNRYCKSVFAGGIVAGMFFMAFLLKWLS